MPPSVKVSLALVRSTGKVRLSVVRVLQKPGNTPLLAMRCSLALGVSLGYRLGQPQHRYTKAADP